METTTTLSFTLPKLNYDYSALEPYIDAKTMEIHYTKHHAGYTNNLNAALEGGTFLEHTIEDLLAHVSRLIPAIRNNGGGYYNHSLFWEIMAPFKNSAPKGKILEALNQNFGSVDALKILFPRLQWGVSDQDGHGW